MPAPRKPGRSKPPATALTAAAPTAAERRKRPPHTSSSTYDPPRPSEPKPAATRLHRILFDQGGR